VVPDLQEPGLAEALSREELKAFFAREAAVMRHESQEPEPSVHLPRPASLS
jgi:hypothetical protein